jgi:hypothetical protein
MQESNLIPPEKQAKLQILIDLVVHFMPLEKWRFKESTRLFSEYRPDVSLPSGKMVLPTVIYDSERCRVMFLLDQERYNDDLVIFYGRKHAPNDKKLMKWDGEECYCWHGHDFDLALKFLDGVSPRETAQKRWPSHGVQEFLKLGLDESIGQPESMVLMHAAVWEFYGNRLFDLFDLRRSELWAQYSQFVREFYDLYGRNLAVPPFDKIC